MTTTAQGLKLGKLAHRHDPRTLRLATFLTPELPAPPEQLQLSHLVQDWPMYANDRLGDCTIAAAAHMTQLWTAMGGQPAAPSEAEVVETYQRLTGGVDSGLVELDVLRDWRHSGLGGETILAFALVSHDPHQIRQAAALAGGLYLGAEMPTAWQHSVGEVWTDAPGADPSGAWALGSWGGHAFNQTDYDPDGLVVVTWGRLQRLSWAGLARYVSEIWAPVPASWREHPPQGVDLDKLLASLAAIGSPTT